MNYYEHHLGDYAKDTGHLTMLEHGAYRMLLDRYYATEAGIPASQAHRVARARSKEEKQAVDDVLEEFFRLADGVWINPRAEDEIAKALVKISAAKENGKKGGRPRNKPKGSETETQQKPTGLFPGSETETQQKAHQAPSTRHQTVNPPTEQASAEVVPIVGVGEPVADALHGRAMEIVCLLKPRGVMLQASNPTVREWAASPEATDTVLLLAMDVAEEDRQKRANPFPVNVGFLNAILPRVMADRKPSAAPSADRPKTREQARTIAATTRLTDFLNDDGTLKSADQDNRRHDDERTLCAHPARLVG